MNPKGPFGVLLFSGVLLVSNSSFLQRLWLRLRRVMFDDLLIHGGSTATAKVGVLTFVFVEGWGRYSSRSRVYGRG